MPGAIPADPEDWIRRRPHPGSGQNRRVYSGFTSFQCDSAFGYSGQVNFRLGLFYNISMKVRFRQYVPFKTEVYHKVDDRQIEEIL